jgi:Fanconi anemia group M protein
MHLTIIADNREKSSGIPELLSAKNVNVIMQQLFAGDYMINDEIVIERKTSEDFVQSIINGRLFGQCAKLKRTGAIPLIIVEGNPYKTGHRISSEAVKGALLSVCLSHPCR